MGIVNCLSVGMVSLILIITEGFRNVNLIQISVMYLVKDYFPPILPICIWDVMVVVLLEAESAIQTN